MKKLLENEFLPYVEAGHERRNLEFKAPFNWDDKDNETRDLKGRTIQALIAMANNPTGGVLIIGIEESGPNILETGLTDKQLSSFEDFEKIKSHIDAQVYGDLEFEILAGYLKGKPYVVFFVSEFSNIPIVSKTKAYPGCLKENQIYIRTSKAPFSSVPPIDKELVELIEMAADKERARLHRRGWIRKNEKDATTLFNEQRKDLQ